MIRLPEAATQYDDKLIIMNALQPYEPVSKRQ